MIATPVAKATAQARTKRLCRLAMVSKEGPPPINAHASLRIGYPMSSLPASPPGFARSKKRRSIVPVRNAAAANSEGAVYPTPRGTPGGMFQDPETRTMTAQPAVKRPTRRARRDVHNIDRKVTAPTARCHEWCPRWPESPRTPSLAQEDVEREAHALEHPAERVVVDVPPQRHQQLALEAVAQRRLRLHGHAARPRAAASCSTIFARG